MVIQREHQKQEESSPDRVPLMGQSECGFSELRSSGQASLPQGSEYQHRAIMASPPIMAMTIITMATSLMTLSHPHNYPPGSHRS